jgi:hypothetical protein
VHAWGKEKNHYTLEYTFLLVALLSAEQQKKTNPKSLARYNGAR